MRRCKAFTLIEVLVALTILALATGSLMSIFSGASRNASVASQRLAALSVAENHLEQVDGAGTWKLGIETGVDGGQFHWTVSVDPIGGNDLRVFQQAFVTVTVDWLDGSRERSLTLRSIRLAEVTAP